MKLPKPIIPILFFSIVSVLFSCAPNKGEQTKEKETSSNTALQPISRGDFEALYAKADKVDIIFYNMPVSVNQDDAASARNTVLYISPDAAAFNPACKPLGRLTWMSGGAIYKEADVYSGTGCQYLVFMENNKPVALNSLAPNGIQFFQNIINQVQQRTQ